MVAKKLSIAVGISSKLQHYVPVRKGVFIKVYYGIAYPEMGSIEILVSAIRIARYFCIDID